MADAFAKHLRARGFNALAAPTGRFQPLALVYEHKGSRGWSSDFAYLARNATGVVPAVDEPTIEPGLSGKEVRNLDVSGTISILSGLIAALGGGTLGLKGGFERASSVTFRYDKVTMTGVSEAALDLYLQSGKADHSSVPGRYLDDHLYVATRVLRSRSFEISAQDSKGQSIGLDLPVISNAIGAGVTAKWSTNSDATIAFEGDRDVTFAFQAVRVLEKDGRMRIFPAKAGSVTTAWANKQFEAREDFSPVIEPDEQAEHELFGDEDEAVAFDPDETPDR